MTLDIDKNSIDRKLRIISEKSPENVMPWLQNDLTKEFPKPHKRVVPFPGACIKTWTENGEKVFINICHSKEIFSPEDISDDKFHQLMDEDVPSFVIPMAIGLEKMAKDKENLERSTFDVLISTEYFQKCMKKSHFWQFTIVAILESINDKYKKNINSDKYIVLKNRKVIGILDTFNIEDRKPKKPVIKKPSIQIIDSQENNSICKSKVEKSKTCKQNVDKKQYSKDENYVIVKTNDQQTLIAFFYLPLSSITDIVTDVGKNRIVVENQKVNSIIDVFLPYNVDNHHVTSNYDSKLHILRLVLPLK